MHWAHCKTTDFSQDELQYAYQQLSPSRKDRIDRLRRQEDKVRSLAAELLVYQQLKEHWNIPSAKLHCKATGQPYLPNHSLHVSISHCDEMVACAISQVPVGIDVERIRPVPFPLFRHICTPEELQHLLNNSAPPANQTLCHDENTLRLFFEIWTAKEAYFKKCGTGITDLKSVNTLSLQRQLYIVEDYFIQIV